MVRSHRQHGYRCDEVDALSELSDSIHQQALILESHVNPYVRCAAKTNRLLSSLCWPLQVNEEAYAVLADGLKNETEHLPGRSCFCMDLTSCQIIVGAITSAAGSESRAWFMNKLRRGVRAMQQRGWDNSFELLEMALRNDEDLLEQLKSLWVEI